MVLNIFLINGCLWKPQPIPPPSVAEEDPRDRLIKALQLTQEQLAQLERGEGTMTFTKEQVDLVRGDLLQLLRDLKNVIDPSKYSEVNEVLHLWLEQGVVDLQRLETIKEAIQEGLSLKSAARVYASFSKLESKPHTSQVQRQDAVMPLQIQSGVTIKYKPRESLEGDIDFDAASYWEATYGRGVSIGYASEITGIFGAYSDVVIVGGASTEAFQRIKIRVPVDNAQIQISAKILYAAGSITFPLPLPFAGASTRLVRAGPEKDAFHPRPETYKVVSPWFEWKDAVSYALNIVGVFVPFPVGTIADAIDALMTITDVYGFQQTLKKYVQEGKAKEENVTYTAQSLQAGDYVFEVGVKAEAVASLGIASAYIFGMVPVVEVTIAWENQQTTLSWRGILVQTRRDGPCADPFRYQVNLVIDGQTVRGTSRIEAYDAPQYYGVMEIVGEYNPPVIRFKETRIIEEKRGSWIWCMKTVYVEIDGDVLFGQWEDLPCCGGWVVLAKETNPSNFAGVWVGILHQTQDNLGPYERQYGYALNLIQTSNKISGTSQIVCDDLTKFAVMSLRGEVVGHYMWFQEVEIKYSNGPCTGRGSWCVKSGILKLTKTGILEGQWWGPLGCAGIITVQKL